MIMLAILMPAYNADRYVRSAIESCLAQLSDYEGRLIVCDDASTDNTHAILTELTETQANLEVIRNDTNRGIGYSRNALLDALPDRTRYVAFMDADDRYVTEALKKPLEALETDAELMMVLGQRQVVPTAVLDQPTPPSSDWPVLIGNTLCSGVYRTRLIKEVGYFDTTFSQGDDIDYLLRMAEITDRRLLLEDIIYYYRRHDANVTRKFNDMRSEFMRALLLHARRRAANPSLKDARGMFPPMDRDAAIAAQRLDDYGQS